MSRAARIFPWAIGLLTAAYIAAYPLLIDYADESFLLYGAKRILHGERIYRDFFEIVTPLGFYFYAAVFALGGTTLRAARLAAALVDGAGAALVFVLARQIAGAGESLVVALLLPTVCVPAWPIASPHWLSTTLQLAVAAVLLSPKRVESDRLRPALAGMLAGAACCVQQQRGPFIVAWVVVSLLVLAWDLPPPQRWRRVWRQLVWFSTGTLAVVAGVLGHAAWAASPRALVAALYTFPLQQYAKAMRPPPWGTVLLIASTRKTYTWPWLLRSAPILLVPEALALSVRGVRGPFGHGERVRLCMVILGVFAALSIRYFPDFIHVAIILPLLAIPGARVLTGLRYAFGRTAHALVVAALLAVLAAKGIDNVRQARAAAPVAFDTAFGRLDGTQLDKRIVSAVQAVCNNEPSGERWLFVFPVEAWLYLATGGNDPTRFSLLLQGGGGIPAYNTIAQVREALADVNRRKTGTVVVNKVFAPEGNRVRRKLERRYALIEEIGPYRIYRRRSRSDLIRTSSATGG